MKTSIKAFAAASIMMALAIKPAISEDQDKQAYGIGVAQCSTITNTYVGEVGQLVMMSYISGFVSAMNLVGTDGDLLNGMTVDTAATSVFKYCKVHRGDQGAVAILHVLQSSMKVKEY